MATFTPPPTYASVVLYDENAADVKALLRSVRFNPIWLKWFVDVAQFITASGGGGGGGADHQSLASLQGGSATERYHLTSAQQSALTAGFTGTGLIVRATSPTLTTPNLGTPSVLVGTNITGTAAGLSIGGSAGSVAVGGITGLGANVATALGVAVGSAGAFITFNGNAGTPSAIVLTNATGTAAGLTAGAVALGGITGLGANVATALAVAVGSAGAFITFNGALGTPSSGTLTNATGLPIGSGVSGLGANVATALAVAVGSAGAFVTFNGAGGTPSSITLTNATGTAAALNIGGNAATVTTNANLTGPVVTSVGNQTTLNMEPTTNSLSGDVALNNTANYFTGPTVAQGSSGTWFASGTVVCQAGAGTQNFHLKLWDGTTIIASAAITVAAGSNGPVALSGYLATPAGDIRISVRDLSGTDGLILADGTGNGKDSTLTVIRIAN